MEEVERVERLAPGKYQTGFVQGRALAAGGHWQTAKAVLDDFIKAQPAHAEALAERARVLLKLEQTAAALQDFRAALAMASTPAPELFIEAADAFAQHGALDEAVEVMRHGITLCGNVPSLLLRSLDHELAAKHFDQALACVAALQVAAPRPEPWMGRRAQILVQAGRAAEAQTAWLNLRTQLLGLPNLERGTPAMSQLLAEAQGALGVATSAPVIAPPAPAKSLDPVSQLSDTP